MVRISLQIGLTFCIQRFIFLHKHVLTFHTYSCIHSFSFIFIHSHIHSFIFVHIHFWWTFSKFVHILLHYCCRRSGNKNNRNYWYVNYTLVFWLWRYRTQIYLKTFCVEMYQNFRNKFIHAFLSFDLQSYRTLDTL